MPNKKLTQSTRTGESRQPDPVLHNALSGTLSVLTHPVELNHVLGRILDDIAQVIPYEMAIVVEIEGETGYVVGMRSKVEQNIFANHSSFPTSQVDILQIVCDTRQPFIIEDTHTHPLWIEVPGHEALRSALCVPLFSSLFSKNEFIGCIGLLASPIGLYDKITAERLQTFSLLASLAITNARYSRQARALASIQEQQRLARELHDSVTQTLFSASTIAEALTLLANNVEKAPTYIAQLATMTREAVLEMRLLSLELHPELLVKTELSLLIKQLCDTFSHRTRIPTEFKALGQSTQSTTVMLPEAIHLMFYRITQETLNNIRQQTSTTAVCVFLTATDSMVELKLRVNGVAFERLGINAIHERTCNSQVQFIIISQPGQDTEIVLRYPL